MRRPFTLTGWFAALGLVAIGLVSVVSSLLLSRFLINNFLERDASVSMEFVQSIVEVQKAAPYFTAAQAPDSNLVEFFSHIATMPSVMRANVFSMNRTILWSSDPKIIGQTFDDNPELDDALSGALRIVLKDVRWKPEHIFLDEDEKGFIENYLPIRSQGQTIGVVEVYKRPHALFASINDGLRLVWLCGIGGGAFLYVALFWLVRRADRVIQEQQARLVESETLGALGAMASAVAHGIRNPLASIRSTAELNLEGASPAAREANQDIIQEVDRLERWVRDLLTYSTPEPGEPEDVRISDVLHDSLNSFDTVFRSHGIEVAWADKHPAVNVRGDHALLAQVFNCLLTNALEAMPEGGRIRVETFLPAPARTLRVSVSDSGVGVASEFMPDVFVPLKSTKPTGLGVGLPLARRIVERFGGTIELHSSRGQGATVNVDLRVAS